MSHPTSPSSDKDDEDDTPAKSAALISVPQLKIDDAFAVSDIDDVDAEFDLKSIVHASRRDEGNSGHGGDSFNASDSVRDNTPLSVPGEETLSTTMRNGRAVPPPLRIVTPSIAASSLPELDEESQRTLGGEGHVREQFEDISLSPPTSPLATTSTSPDQVPVPVTPHSLTSPSSTNLSLNVSAKSLSSDSPRPPSILRSVSPRPHYLSPTSTIPVPPSVDPVPKRAPTPSNSELPKTPRSPHPSTPSSARPSSSTARHSRSSASTTSVLEKFLSKTRPAHLPPKPRDEDLKHQRDWDAMMRRSREADEIRRQKQRARAQEREMEIAERLAVWEREIVPDWRKVLKPGLERYRKMWWSGIPAKLRGTLWSSAIGNSLALSKGMLCMCRNVFPKVVLPRP